MTDASPTTVNRTLVRKPNAAYRSREYLTEAEVIRRLRRRESEDAMAQGMHARSCSRIDTGCEPRSFARSAGRRSIFGMVDCTSTERRAALKACIPCTALSCER